MTKMPFLEINKENRFIPSMAIYGANASGKTNIVRAFSTYKSLIRDTEISGLYFPNKLNKKHNTAAFEIEFFIGNDKYKHFIEYDKEEIKKEILYKKKEKDILIYEIDNIVHQHNFKNISTDEYDNNRINAILNIECSEQKKDSNGNEQSIQKRAFLSVIAKRYSGLNSDITNVYKEIINMFVSGSNDFFKKVLEKCKETNDTYIDKTSDFIRNFDIDISKIQPTTKKFHISDIRLPVEVINQLDKMDEARQKEFGYDAQEHSVTINTVDVYHKDINNEEVIFDFLKNESKGTQILFGLMYLILRELDTGRTLIIDEIDRSIHPLVFAKIIELFKDKEYNTKNAQLIFTTHCTDILEMDILRISEVATINKTISNGSTITRISDFKYSGNFKNIRNTTDFRKLYLQGAFSGIPLPHI